MVLKPSELSRDTKDVLIQHYIDRFVQWGTLFSGVRAGNGFSTIRMPCPRDEVTGYA